MAEGNDYKGSAAGKEKDDIFSNAVRAGKRTYFFDVKATRRNDQYLTITESKKRYNNDGRFFYEKHKIFLYREDFQKFLEGLNSAMDYIENAQEEGPLAEIDAVEKINVEVEEPVENNYTDIEFEDLEVVEEDGMK